MDDAGGRTADAAMTLAMRREIYSKDVVTRDDFLRLLAAGRAAGAQAAPEFDQLLAEVATDLLVRQAHPPKYIAQTDAGWLMSVLADGSGLSWRAERDIFVGLMREAASIPPSLSNFIVSKFEQVATAGHVAAGGADHPAGVVTPEDLESLRNVIFAATEGSALYVTREEAEALFRIAHATEAAQNAPGFDEFFAKAIGNYLMGVVFDRAMTPAAAARRRRSGWTRRRRACPISSAPCSIGMRAQRRVCINRSRASKIAPRPFTRPTMRKTPSRWREPRRSTPPNSNG